MGCGGDSHNSEFCIRCHAELWDSDMSCYLGLRSWLWLWFSSWQGESHETRSLYDNPGKGGQWWLWLSEEWLMIVRSG